MVIYNVNVLYSLPKSKPAQICQLMRFRQKACGWAVIDHYMCIWQIQNTFTRLDVSYIMRVVPILRSILCNCGWFCAVSPAIALQSVF